MEHAKPGDTSNRWTVLDPDVREKGRRKYLCRCDCGTERLLGPTDFVQSRTKSCGCLNAEVSRERATKHGRRFTKLNAVWANMRARCTNPKHIGWVRYGGRGITVCEEWDDFTVFREWALDAGYVEDADYRQEVDRIDNDGPYSPDNCRVVSPKKNRQNTSASHMLTAFGEMKSMGAWADDPRCVVSYYTLRTRTQRGWDTQRALTEGTHNTGRPRRGQ